MLWVKLASWGAITREGDLFPSPCVTPSGDVWSHLPRNARSALAGDRFLHWRSSSSLRFPIPEIAACRLSMTLCWGDTGASWWQRPTPRPLFSIFFSCWSWNSLCFLLQKQVLACENSHLCPQGHSCWFKSCINFWRIICCNGTIWTRVYIVCLHPAPPSL